MLNRWTISVAFFAMTSVAIAEPYKEVTIGLPVPSLEKAIVWYLSLLGPDVEMISPAPSVVEFKIAPSVWLQLFEVDNQEQSDAVIRFSVDDFEATQQALMAVEINSGDAVIIPDIVTFSEFTDPFGNALGLYSVP